MVRDLLMKNQAVDDMFSEKMVPWPYDSAMFRLTQNPLGERLIMVQGKIREMYDDAR